jgi:Periplasmic binding protein
VRPQIRAMAAFAAVAVLAAGCSRAAGGTSVSQTTPTASAAATAAAGGFGTLKGVCHPGTPTSASDQGVTASEVRVGVFTDESFTNDPTFADTAAAFTAWCNAAGGIDGRKIVYDILDTGLFNVEQRMVQGCADDFVLVGGGAALDELGVETRLKCLLPSFPAQVTSVQNEGSSLQVYPAYNNVGYSGYAGYYNWLINDAYPGSKDAVGSIVGDVSVTETDAAENAETIAALGGKVAYNSLYPPLGVVDWTPYAQAIVSKGIKGLVFYGQYQDLAKLELILTGMHYKLDWIDANSDAYTPAFTSLLGPSLTYQNNYADLSGVYPLEKAASNPADQQLISLFAQYDASFAVSFPAVGAFASWLLFAEAAESCGNNLTRACIYTAATSLTSWTAGGLQAPLNLTPGDTPGNGCFNVEQETAKGWEPASFGANSDTDGGTDGGAYRCGGPYHKFTGNYGSPLTLADVGKSMSDLK